MFSPSSLSLPRLKICHFLSFILCCIWKHNLSDSVNCPASLPIASKSHFWKSQSKAYHCMAESIDSLVSTLAHWGMWLGWPWRVWADRRRSTGHLSQIHNSDEKPFLGISWYIVKSMWLEEMAAIVKDAAGVLSFWLCASLWCCLWESSRWKVGGNKQNTMWHSYNFKISLIFGLTHP